MRCEARALSAGKILPRVSSKINVELCPRRYPWDCSSIASCFDGHEDTVFDFDITGCSEQASVIFFLGRIFAKMVKEFVYMGKGAVRLNRFEKII